MRTRELSIVLFAALAAACKSGASPAAEAAVPQAPPAESEAPARPVNPAEPAAPDRPAAGSTAPVDDSQAATAVQARTEPAPATEEGAELGAPAKSRTERVAELTQAFDEARNANFKAYRKAFPGNDEPSREALEKFYAENPMPDANACLVSLRAIVDEDPSDPAVIEAVQWIAITAPTPNALSGFIAVLEKHHLERAEFGELCEILGNRGESGLLAKVLERSSHVDVRGRACLALAEAKKQDVETARRLSTTPEDELDGWKGYLGAERVAALKALDIAATERETEALLERAAKEFGHVVLNKGSKREITVGERAGIELFEIRNLAVGKTAPEIEGVDLDGEPFKLSDYRGKVVLLDFWGNW